MRFDPMERLNLGISAGAVAAGFALASPVFATSLAFGAAIEAANFRALRSAASRLFGGDLPAGRGAPGPPDLVMGNAWAAGFGLRFGFLAIAISLALDAGAHPVGLVIGLSTTIPAVVLGAIWMRPPILESGPAPLPDDPSWDAWNPWLARERDPAAGEED